LARNGIDCRRRIAAVDQLNDEIGMTGILRRVVGGIAMGMCLTAFAGCQSENRSAVDGKVTLDGAVVDGTISFIPTDGKSRSGAWGEIKSGRYSISATRGPVVGNYRIELSSVRKTGRILPAPPPMNQREELVDVIPVRYNSHSELKAEIKPGQNEVNFQLQSK
jgi:hypothetical protein